LLLCLTARAGDLFDDVETVAGELRAAEPSRRREAVDKLDAYRNSEVRLHLLAALSDPDLEVRVRASLALGRRHLSEATPKLVGLLGDPEPRLRAAVSAALGQLAGDADPPWPERTTRALERALGDAEHEVREAAVAALGALPLPLGRSAAVAITGRLDDDHPAVRQKAAVVLARLGESRAVIPLVGRLSDGSREVRVAALEALGELGDAKAAPAMIRLLNDNAEEVRAQAIQSLGRLKARAAVAPLTELLERGAEPLRGRAAVALGQVASASSGDGDPAVTALVSALARDDLRQAAQEGLRLTGSAAVAPLAARIPVATGEELAVEVDLLGELGDARAGQVLLGELQRGRLSRERVVTALGRVARNDHDLLVELAALLADPETGVRRQAARALTGVVDERAAAALAEATADGDREVRLMAIAELGRLRAQRALPSLQQALGSADVETAAAAARALGELSDKKAGAALEAALGKSDRRLRREAADALGRLGDVSIVPAVMRRSRSSGPERAEALVALGGLLRGRSDPTARELLLGYAEGNDAPLALEAVDALAAMRDAASGARLGRLLNRRDSELRRHVTRALGEIGGAETELIGRLGDDPDAIVQAEAAWALGKGKGGPASLAALERAFFHAAPEVRADAAAAVARLGHAPDGLSRLLHDPDPAVRTNAGLAVKHGWKPGVRSDWIGLYLVDFDGAPLAGARYRLRLPDGLIKAGQADPGGAVREESLPRGACQLELVDEPPGRS
jgi:HEAT repeat protein